MKKIKEIFSDKTIYLFAIITICFFGAFVKMQYAPDTYFVFSDSIKAVITQFSSCGRFVTAIMAGVCLGILKLSDKSIYILSYAFALLCTIISLYRLFKLINKDLKNKILSGLITTLVIINIFSFELYVYIEKGIMIFSVLMCILAVEQVDKYLENKNWKYFVWSIFYMLIATFSYQGTVGIFVTISLIYIIKNSKTVIEFLLNNLKVALIYGIPAIVNFILVRFTNSNSRVEGNIILSESVQKIIEGTKNLLINTYELFPKYLFSICILGIIVFAIYKAILSIDGKTKDKLLKISGLIYILAGTLFATVAPQILQNTDSIWFVARSSYPMASVIGILLIYIFNNFNISNIEKKSIIILSIVFMIIQLIFFMRFTIDGYTVNYIDKQQAIQIINKINNYEEKTGNKITKISFYQDKSTSYVYPNIKASGDINIRAFSKDWVSVAIIKYYSGRKLENIKGSDQLVQNFQEHDWNEYNQEQIKFENDTIHVCLY